MNSNSYTDEIFIHLNITYAFVNNNACEVKRKQNKIQIDKKRE